MTSAQANTGQIVSECVLADEAATVALGSTLSEVLAAGMVVYLHGDLGAGKTTLTRGILRGFGHEGRVKSPTYALVEVYAVSRLNLYHFDFYRMSDPEEWHEAGFRDFFNPTSLCVVEWPEKANGSGVNLPPADLEIFLTVVLPPGATQPQRLARLQANTSTTSAKLTSASALNAFLQPPA
jgi:tRNA threonylcarbamoyladenosine biosynthesis protein TsaE